MGKTRYSGFFGLILVVLLSGCSGEPTTGPVAVKWDRDQCERCRMVVSDPLHAAQIRQPAGEGRSKVYRFDDFGCAVIWLDQQSWKNEPGVEFWVTDFLTREWVNVEQATFVMNRVTPMGYGLGAQLEPGERGMSFSKARDHVYEVEQRFHSSHHHQPVVVEVDDPSAPPQQQ